MVKAVIRSPSLCTRFHRAIELIGRRWTGAIIFVLLQRPCRFAALRSTIPEMTDRMLVERLQELEREGIVERTVVPEMPVKVEYALTDKGRALGDAMKAMSAWADKWVAAPTVVAEPAARRSSEVRPHTRARARAIR